jgi:dipeptidyl-peptidase-4
MSKPRLTPPVDWRFYDSMYTERYMKTLAANPAGYSQAAVRNATGFLHVAGGVLVQHGTGDDNVHFQNSAVLVDTLVAQGVSPRKLSVMWFTDQDHSIAGAGAARFVYKQLTERLWAEKERGAGVAHQWDRRRRMRKGVRTG